MRYLHLSKRFRVLVVGFVFMLACAPAAASEYVNENLMDKTDPAYWLDQGGLFATYGNHTAAVRAYQKAIELDPENSEAYFNLGVTYGEMDDLDQALLYINKAISLDDSQERYYYGRAWVLLIAGKKEEALQDFEKAAAMGDLDAIIYLKQEAAKTK